MKYRQGFVSNSSTSSFLLFGVVVDSEFIKKYNLNFEDGVRECFYGRSDELEKLDLTAENPCYMDQVFLGTSWSHVRDNETGAQFKQRVAHAIQEALGIMHVDLLPECKTHQYAWRDG